jgi:hypothetical protein
MINHILNSSSVNKTYADFTSWICVVVLLCPQCQNERYFTDLQPMSQRHESLASTKNVLNQRSTMPRTNFVRLKNRATCY